MTNADNDSAKEIDPATGLIKEARFLEQVKMFFGRAASKTTVPKDYLDMIMACDSVLRLSIPIRRDNGQI